MSTDANGQQVSYDDLASAMVRGHQDVAARPTTRVMTVTPAAAELAHKAAVAAVKATTETVWAVRSDVTWTDRDIARPA